MQDMMNWPVLMVRRFIAYAESEDPGSGSGPYINFAENIHNIMVTSSYSGVMMFESA